MKLRAFDWSWLDADKRLKVTTRPTEAQRRAALLAWGWMFKKGVEDAPLRPRFDKQ